jgi:FAD/FMN-containing dehydrogenase
VELGGVASVKVYAGEQMRELYAYAVGNNVTIVGGADMDVGVGGWVSAGGHSPISSKYGLGADQVVAMEVVTADGKFRCIDKDNESDLFWALRGVSQRRSLRTCCGQH